VRPGLATSKVACTPVSQWVRCLRWAFLSRRAATGEVAEFEAIDVGWNRRRAPGTKSYNCGFLLKQSVTKHEQVACAPTLWSK